MKLTYPAKIAVVCGVFLLVFIVFSSFDLALSFSISLYLIFFHKKVLSVFMISIILFIADSLYRSSDFHIRFITDLSVDAYILFLSSVVIYFKSRGDIDGYLSKINKSNRKIISKEVLLPVAGTIIFILLFLPILGGFLSILSGYIIYCFIRKQFSGKIAVVFSISLLILAAFFLLIKKTAISEELGNYTFYFLIIGAIQEVINLIIQKSSIRKTKEDEHQNKYLREEFQVKLMQVKNNFSFARHHIPKINPPVVLIIVSLLTFLLLLYFFYPNISKNNFFLSKSKISFKIPAIDFMKKSPTPTSIPKPVTMPSPSPSITPTPISKVSASVSSLKILVLNGTEITGLAGSTSAKLKKVGFQNIEVGNAKTSDYKTWEATLKKHDEDIAGILNHVLELETLTVKETSSGAKFDIEIIAGEKK